MDEHFGKPLVDVPAIVPDYDGYALMKLVDGQPPWPRPVSVKERLPEAFFIGWVPLHEDGERDRERTEHGMWYFFSRVIGKVESDAFNGGVPSIQCDDCSGPWITHWLPLPPAPKGGA